MLREEDGGPAAGGGAPSEIVQSRDLTMAEGMALTRAVIRRYGRGLGWDFWYWVAIVGHFGGVFVLADLATKLSYWARCCDPSFVWWSNIAVASYIVGGFLYWVRYFRFIADANRSASPAGTRHVIDDRGYRIEQGDTVSIMPWAAILDVERLPTLLLTATSRVQFRAIIPAAFENQDAAGFSAELERRWKAAKGVAHAG